MLIRSIITWCVISSLAAIIVLGCNNSQQGTVSPNLQTATTNACEINTRDSKVLWGIWDVTIDTERGFIEALPLRGAEFTANVTVFLQPPMGKLSNLKFSNLDLSKWSDTGVLEIDVGLTHPFPGLEYYTGFDVMGVFRHDGSYISDYDPAVTWGKPGVDGVLLNADGYTRWFNAVEFTTSGILGYVPGAAGTKGFNPTATLNGFKYFADSLGLNDDLKEFFSDENNCSKRGCFKPGSTNFRHYVIQFPMGSGGPILKFQYSVIASWEPPVSGPPYPVENFPISANMKEGLILSVDTSGSNLYYVNSSIKGGTLSVQLEILDHQAGSNPLGVTGEIAGVILESKTNLFGGLPVEIPKTVLESSAQDGGPCSSVYSIEVTDCTPESQKEHPLLIWVLSEDPTSYNSGIPGWVYPVNAKLSSHVTAFVKIKGEVPNLPPVGGELSYHWDCPGEPCSGQQITIEISKAYDPDGDPVTITWDFDGDLDFDDDTDGDVSNLSAIAVWSVPGMYDVRCRIKDSNSFTDVGPLSVNVQDCIPDSPVLVKTVPDTTGLQARKISYNPKDGYIYTIPHYSGSSSYVCIVDVDPVADAHVVKILEFPGMWLATVEYYNGYVYASGNANGGVLAIDVDPPESASLVGTWNPGFVTGSMEDMEVINGRLYVAGQWWGMIVLDITNPALPVHLGHTGTAHAFTSSIAATPDGLWGFTTDGYHNSGYLSWVNVVNLSNPSNPTIVKSLQIQNYDVLPTNCDYDNGYLYVVYHPWTGTGYLTVIDVHDPMNPVKLTDFPVGAGTWDVEIDGTYAYVSRSNLSIVDISKPNAPVLLSSVAGPTEIRGTAVYCGTVFAGTSLVSIFDTY